MSIYVWTSEIKNVYIWTTPVKEVYVWTTKVRPSEITETYTISNVPNNNSNVYVNIAKSWYTVKSVKFKCTASSFSSSSSTVYMMCASNNSNKNRYWPVLLQTETTIIGRLNWASNTVFQEKSSSPNYTFSCELSYNSWTMTINGTTYNWTPTTAEKNIINTIFSSSTMNVYASREYVSTLSNIEVIVTYKPN